MLPAAPEQHVNIHLPPTAHSLAREGTDHGKRYRLPLYSPARFRKRMIKTTRNQVIALAGLSQALCMVQQIARKGYADREDVEACIDSTLKIDADDVLDVYGGLPRLQTGLRQLERQLAGPERVDPEQARYASVLVFLERKLMERADMLAAIHDGICQAATQAVRLGSLHEEVLQALADLYQHTVSRLKPKVMVMGEQSHLSDPDNANLIRALLLAGIRSVVLWRQCGGSRLKLLFGRGAMQNEVRELLKSVR